MKKEEGFTLIELIIIIVIIGLLSLMVVFAIQAKKRRGYIITPKEQCLEAGGIFFPGGFGAANCVFKPE